MYARLADPAFHLVVLRTPASAAIDLPAGAWLAVERFADERAARARYHEVQPAALALSLGVALLRAQVTPATGALIAPRTLLSAGVELSQLYQAQILLASAAQRERFELAIERSRKALADDLARRLRAPGRRNSRALVGWALSGGVAALLLALLISEFTAAKPAVTTLGEGINRVFGVY